MPFVTLAVMTFPAMLGDIEAGNLISALPEAAAFVVAMIIAYCGGDLPIVATIACVVVFVVQSFI